MHEYAGRLVGPLVSADDALDREFEVRLAECSSLAVRVAYGVLRQRQDAEDVAQDALAKAHRNFRQLRDRDSFKAWLVRMTWRLALDRRRGDLRRAARESAAIEPDAPPTAEDQVIAQQRADRLWRAIDQLPEKLRLVIVLASIEGHGTQEVADLLGVPQGTVKSRMFEARKHLMEALR